MLLRYLANGWLRYGLALLFTWFGATFLLTAPFLGPNISTLPLAFLVLHWMRQAGFLLCAIAIAVALVQWIRDAER